MGAEYKMQLQEAHERVVYLEAENKEIMADLATARKVIDAKNRLLEEHQCRIGKLQEVIKDIIDKI